MTDSLVLYSNPMSRGRIARWMLEEVGGLGSVTTADVQCFAASFLAGQKPSVVIAKPR